MDEQECTQDAGGSSSEEYPHIDISKTHWIRVFVEYMLKNKPCVLCPSATRNWPSRELWVKRTNGREEINLDYIRDLYGDMEVPLMDAGYGEYQTVRLSSYIDYLKDRGNNSDGKYVKDWHFQKDSGTSYGAYSLPSFLKFDWINNEQWSSGENDPFGDYRFVYFGVKNSWTVFHSDVMSSYSWSANICGRKLWYFVPPGKEEMFRKNKDQFIEDIRTARDKWSDAGVVSFIQKPGEVVFVPSNWYHQVHNLEDAISINHNFINASNVDLMLKLVCDRLEDVRREIADVKDVFSKTEFDDQCQKILKADIRVNFDMLRNLAELVIKNRSKQVDERWTCPKHGDDVFECKKDDACLQAIMTSVQQHCTCEEEGMCSNCDRFMKKYELSCALKCVQLIDDTVTTDKY